MRFELILNKCVVYIRENLEIKVSSVRSVHVKWIAEPITAFLFVLIGLEHFVLFFN